MTDIETIRAPLILDGQKINSLGRLITEHYRKNPHSQFFADWRREMTGERICDMRLLVRKKQVKDRSFIPRTCYVVSSLQRKGFKGMIRVYHYFDEVTLEHIMSIERKKKEN